MALLQIENLTFRYPEGNDDALQDVFLTVKAGEFVVLSGASGSGKSTLLRLIKREIAPYGTRSGRILYDGEALETLDERKAVREIGFVFQDPESQIVTDKVWHELAFGMESLGLSNAEIRRRTAEIAGYFGIVGLMDRDTADLSGGEKQMLNLASVLAMRPKLLLLDEPTAQLDPVAAVNFLNTLRKLNRETGLTVFLSEHRLEEALPEADRFLLTDGGRLVFDGDPRRADFFFREHPEHPMRNALPAALRLFGRDAAGAGETAPLTVREGRAYLQAHYKNEIRSLKNSGAANGTGTPPPSGTRSEKEALPGKHRRGENAFSLEFDRVSFRYEKEGNDLLKAASLKVRAGEHFAILGGNGAGKSTALRMAAGLLKPYRGEIRVFGRKLTDFRGQSLYRNGVAMLPQHPETLFLKKTLEEDFTAFVKTSGIDRAAGEEKIRTLAKRFGLGHLLSRHPYDLSGGEQEKAALLKALLSEPGLLLLDEPTKGLDASFKQELISIIRELNEAGVTVVTVTHDAEFAAEAADRATFLFGGEFLPPSAPDVFFSDNMFYTTAADRISRGFYDDAVLVRDVEALMTENGGYVRAKA